MSIEQIKEIVTLIDQSDLSYFSYKSNEFELVLSKREQADMLTTTLPTQKENTEHVVSHVSEGSERVETAVAPVGKTVDSPLVGIVYLAPSPESPVFKQVGDTVEVGDVLCIVEAMKIMNEIKSNVSGVVSEVLVDNQSIVEFGQPLFRIV